MGPDLLNPMHLMVLAVLGLLLFGPKRLPEIGRSLGTGLREFKTTIGGVDGVSDAVRGIGQARTATPMGMARTAIQCVVENPDGAGTAAGLPQTGQALAVRADPTAAGAP